MGLNTFLFTLASLLSAEQCLVIMSFPMSCACHMVHSQIQDNPLASGLGFELMDGRLTVLQLMSPSLPRAQLVFLSACESACSDRNLPDETLNLAATMLFMGFKSMTGTMW